MRKEKSQTGRYFLTLVFASILLLSFGTLAHSAFADQVVAIIPVNGAYGVATNSNTNLTYVATGKDYQVQVIDDKTNTVTATIQTRDPVPVSNINSGSCRTLYVAVNQNTNMIYAYNGGCQYIVGSYGKIHVSPTISAINGTTNSIVASISLPEGGDFGSFPIAVNPVTNKIYAINPAFGVYVIDGKTNAATLVNLGNPYCSSDYFDVTVNPQTNMIYVLQDTLTKGYISVINGTSNSIVNTCVSWGGYSQNGIAVNPTTNLIYISNSDNSVSVINGTTYHVTATIQGSTYGFVGVNPVTNKIYVSNPNSGQTVSVIDGSTNTQKSNFIVGLNPYGIGVNTVTNKIYVGDAGSSTVSVIDGSLSILP